MYVVVPNEADLGHCSATFVGAASLLTSPTFSKSAPRVFTSTLPGACHIVVFHVALPSEKMMISYGTELVEPELSMVNNFVLELGCAGGCSTWSATLCCYIGARARQHDNPSRKSKSSGGTNASLTTLLLHTISFQIGLGHAHLSDI